MKNKLDGKELVRQDILFNNSESKGLSFSDYEIIAYVFQRTEVNIPEIWSNLEISAKSVSDSLERLIKNKLILKIKDKKGDKVHLTEKGVLLSLLLDTYAMYASAAEQGEPIVAELMSYLHMITVPSKDQRLELSKQLERIALDILKKSQEIKNAIKEEV